MLVRFSPDQRSDVTVTGNGGTLPHTLTLRLGLTRFDDRLKVGDGEGRSLRLCPFQPLVSKATAVISEP